jgi:hypothetical protein
MKKRFVILFVLGLFSCSPKENKPIDMPLSVETELEIKKDGQNEIMGKFKPNLPAELNYLLTLPKEYKVSGDPSPLIVFMHGGDERGKNY